MELAEVLRSTNNINGSPRVAQVRINKEDKNAVRSFVRSAHKENSPTKIFSVPLNCVNLDTPAKKQHVKRNLNESFNSTPNSQCSTPGLNYSIVKEHPAVDNDLKIVLRLSCNQPKVHLKRIECEKVAPNLETNNNNNACIVLDSSDCSHSDGDENVTVPVQDKSRKQLKFDLKEDQSSNIPGRIGLRRSSRTTDRPDYAKINYADYHQVMSPVQRRRSSRLIETPSKRSLSTGSNESKSTINQTPSKKHVGAKTPRPLKSRDDENLRDSKKQYKNEYIDDDDLDDLIREDLCTSWKATDKPMPKSIEPPKTKVESLKRGKEYHKYSDDDLDDLIKCELGKLRPRKVQNTGNRRSSRGSIIKPVDFYNTEISYLEFSDDTSKPNTPVKIDKAHREAEILLADAVHRMKIKQAGTPKKMRSRLNSIAEQPFVEIEPIETTMETRTPKKPNIKNPMDRCRTIEKTSTPPASPGTVLAEKTRSLNISTPKKNVKRTLSTMSPPSVSDIAALSENTYTPSRRTRRADTITAETIRTPKSHVDAVKKQILSTPSSTGHLSKRDALTPSVEVRKTAVRLQNTPLHRARNALHVAYIPDALPCREKEFTDIMNFVEGKLGDECGGCMYVSGVPGTGKTASVTYVIRQLQEKAQKGKVAQFDFISINGMRLTEPRQSYVEILKQLNGLTVPWEQAQSQLDAIFTKKGKKIKPIVLLVDELDILCTKRQDVVYNLLDWPSRAYNQLVVITIANTMDLPERLLMGRVTSRLGLTRLTFQAYNHKQLQEIVTKRLSDTNTFNPDAIQLVARKVASVSGDARRALDICRRAAEFAEAEGPKTLVSMKHVNDALSSMMTQPKVQAIKCSSRLQQLLLQSVAAEVERTGVEETSFAAVFKMFASVAAIEGFSIVSMTAAMMAVGRLGSSRLLLLDQKLLGSINQRVMLNVSADDVYYALRKEE